MSTDVAKASTTGLTDKIGSSATPSGAVESQSSSQPAEKAEQPKPVFAEDTASILAKYANAAPSIELHIHPTHYRFSGQEGIIPKNNPVMDMFLQSVREGILPAVASEVFRDSGITLYEGCAILKLVDFRNFSRPNGQPQTNTKQDESKQGEPEKKDDKDLKDDKEPKEPQNGNSVTDDQPPSSEPIGANEVAKEANITEKAEPPSFRVLLRPTGCSLLNDLMGLSDTGTGRRLTDFFAISMESEILNATVRQLDLRRPLRREYDAGLRATLSLAAHNKAAYFRHRLTHPRKLRRAVEESSHKGSAYEEFMLEMADLDKPSRGSSQFVRMNFIEQLRRKKNIGTPRPGSTTPIASRDPRAAVSSSASSTSSTTSTTSANAAASLNLRPTKISQPGPAQLAKQLFQSQQMAQQATRMQQQALVQQLAMNHVPPGPTAQHQIQAQQQQQAILRARAQQQQMMWSGGASGAGAGAGGAATAGGTAGSAGTGAPTAATAPQTRMQQPVGPQSAAAAAAAGMGTTNTGNQQMMAQMGRPMSALGQSGAASAGQRLARPMSKVNGMSMNQMNMVNSPAMMNGQMGSPMLNNMNPQMGNQMGMHQMGNQMGNQLGGQMGNQLGGQMGNQLGGQMGNQMGNQLGGQMGGMRNQLASQMGKPMNSQMTGQMNQLSPQMRNQMSPQMGTAQMSPQMGMANPMSNQLSPQMGNQLSPQMNSQLGGQMGRSMAMNNQMNSQMAMNNQMGMNRGMPMSPLMGNASAMSPSSPMQVPNRINRQSPGSMQNMALPQQVPTQVPSQVQQMQARRPSQLTPAQMRQIMLNRARAQQQAQ